MMSPLASILMMRNRRVLSRKIIRIAPAVGSPTIRTVRTSCVYHGFGFPSVWLRKSPHRYMSSFAAGDSVSISSHDEGKSKNDVAIPPSRTITAASASKTYRIRRKIPFVVQRGGTSKGIFFRKHDLPACPKLRDLVIQDAFGSPDIRQIDGLGGADVLTSKVAIVSERNNNSNCNSNINDRHTDTDTENAVADVDYLFGQVEFGGITSTDDNHDNENGNKNDVNDIGTTPRILYDVNCGNISAGVGPYAIEEGLIEVNDDTVTPTEIDGGTSRKYHQKVRIYNVNTDKIILAEVPVEKVLVKHEDDCMTADAHWMVVEDGQYKIDGVPGTSAYLPLDFSNCVGTLGNSESNQGSFLLLPTGNVRDTVVVDDRSYDVSLLDVANFVVHIDGRQLGLTGKEPSVKILNDVELWNTVRRIRYEAAKLVMKEHEITLTKPFTSVVFPFLRNHGYESIRGDRICDDDIDLIDSDSDTTIDFRSFVLFCDHPHKAYPGTASNATAAAALIDGTVVNDVMNKHIETATTKMDRRNRGKIVTIGHPSGRMLVSSKIEETKTAEERLLTENNTSLDATAAAATSAFSLKRSVIGRTSRRIADGCLYLKPDTVRRLNNSK